MHQPPEAKGFRREKTKNRQEWEKEEVGGQPITSK
jgi:hypothetical protein